MSYLGTIALIATMVVSANTLNLELGLPTPPEGVEQALIDTSGLWVPPACIGDGDSGARVQLVYIHDSGSNGHISEMSDWVYLAASATTGLIEHSSEGKRTIRWAMDRECRLSIIDVEAPANQLRTYHDIKRHLRQVRGLTSRNRTYLVYVDAEPNGNWAGMGSAGLAMVWRNGWAYADAHELLHALGAVADDAPHSTGAGHCNDGHDLMCYDDGGPKGQQDERCNEPQSEWLLDCGNDDYFAVHPAPRSWLARHPQANVAGSKYLETIQPRLWPAAAAPPDNLTATREADGAVNISWSVPAGVSVDVTGWAGTGIYVVLGRGVSGSSIHVPNQVDLYHVMVRARSAAGYSAEVSMPVSG